LAEFTSLEKYRLSKGWKILKDGLPDHFLTTTADGSKIGIIAEPNHKVVVAINHLLMDFV
jgi:hypothetical protein